MNNFNLKIEQKILNTIQSNFGPEVFSPGLERSKPLYVEYIKNFKEKNVKIITIAGTNGKGQTTHTLGQNLVARNVNIAWWTSPHILSIRERFHYCDSDISYSELELAVEKCLLKIAHIDFKISFYEFLFLVFLDWISTKKLDFIILEVGLGGKFDAVNHFDADLTLITSISRDHQAILGNSYKKILHEKLGVTRANKKLITSFKLEYLIQETKEYSLNNKVNYSNIVPSNDYFQSNINLANAALEYFGFNLTSNLKMPKFKGREEVLSKENLEFTFIGAHNPDGMRETVKRLNREYAEFDLLLLSFSKRDEQDIVVMLKTISKYLPIKTSVKLCLFEHSKAINLKILEDVQKMVCHNRNVELIIDWKVYLDELYKNKENKKILVMGSYYFIGEIQSNLYSIC